MKIFITGGSGLLGQYLNIELSKKNEILTQYYNHSGNCLEFNSIQMPITNFKKLEGIFESFRPDAVIHTAAVSNAERADALPADVVYNINVNTTEFIASLCRKFNSRLIYTSTDLVYAGYRGSMLKEDAKLVPISLYAETKLMGEIKLRQMHDNYLILRVPLQIGFGLNHASNNFHKLYLNLKEGNTSKLFVDQFRTPLALHESARIISNLVDKNICNEIINLAGDERVSRYQLGEILCRLTGFDKKLITPVTMEDVGLLYRVEDVSMSNQKLKSFGINPESLESMIEKSFTYLHE